MPENKIEVEMIGELSKEKFTQLENLFKQQGGFVKEKNRVSLMYFRDYIPIDIKEIKDELVDLRIRATNGKWELVTKYGKFGGENIREEISIPIPDGKIADYVRALHLLGWSKGVLYATQSRVYNFQGIELSLVKIAGHGYNYEAEIIADLNEIEEAKRKINSVLKQLGLSPFSPEDLARQCNAINNKKELQFDFAKQSFQEVISKFSKLT